MKKIVINLSIFFFLILIVLITVLSTIGIETSKFNKAIIDKASKSKNINLNLNKIKFKLDLKKLSLFLETQNTKINYLDIEVPIRNIKIYVDFISILKSEPKIKKTNIFLEQLSIEQVNKLSILIKPSNFKSLLNNRIKKGNLISEVEIFFTNQGSLKNFIAKGKVTQLEARLLNGIHLNKTSFNFFADKNDILLKNIFGEIESIKIIDGDLKLNIDNGIKINSNFKSKVNIDEKNYEIYEKFLEKYINTFKVKSLIADLNNNFSFNLDNTYKLKDYDYRVSGNLEKGNFKLTSKINSEFTSRKINEIYLSDLKIKTVFLPEITELNGKGKYSFNNKDFLSLDFSNQNSNDLFKLNTNFDYKDNIEISLINYNKPESSIASISLDLEKKNKITKINKLLFKEDENLIKIFDLSLRNNNFSSFKEILVKTSNNDFLIKKSKKILIKGKKFDATNLIKIFSNQNKENKFNKLNSEIEIDFENTIFPMTKELKNFKLIGEIKKGKFIKISSKGDFGNNNFLDISMKTDKNQRKYLEIYSDLTKPLLAEYGFFNGLSGGKLFFTSLIEEEKSSSNLKIENFKVVNAPGVIRLLSLADLGGLVDLAEGEGLSFDILEINMEKNNEFLRLNEIVALGPSMSVLMDGYQNKDLTSLRGTLVPAKTLNNIIAKIPLIGNIIIPKEAGEGLFGISFKMKGPKDKIKTTINPIRTLTPRFIQKIIDKKKKLNNFN